MCCVVPATRERPASARDRLSSRNFRFGQLIPNEAMADMLAIVRVPL